jgi:hypothetical protein
MSALSLLECAIERLHALLEGVHLCVHLLLLLGLIVLHLYFVPEQFVHNVRLFLQFLAVAVAVFMQFVLCKGLSSAQCFWQITLSVAAFFAIGAVITHGIERKFIRGSCATLRHSVSGSVLYMDLSLFAEELMEFIDEIEVLPPSELADMVRSILLRVRDSHA